MSARPLDTVLADWRSDAQVLRRRGHEHDAALIEQIVGDVATAAEEYLTWLTEFEATLRSGKSTAWLRGRFPGWLAEGHARQDGPHRRYRMLVIPKRPRTDAAYEAGREAGAA